MNKDTIKSFILWLEQASMAEIEARKKAFQLARLQLSSPEAKSDIKLGLRLIDEEILARLEVSRIHNQQQ